MFSFKSASLTLATIGLLAASGTHARAEDGLTQTRLVRTADLDLHTLAGADTLRHRVRLAARQVCGEPASFASPEGAGYTTCVANAERNAASATDAMIAAVQTGNRFAMASPGN